MFLGDVDAFLIIYFFLPRAAFRSGKGFGDLEIPLKWTDGDRYRASSAR